VREFALALVPVALVLSGAAAAPVNSTELARGARAGDPVAFGRLWAHSIRCKLDQEVAGAAAAVAILSAMEHGRASSAEDFFAKSKAGSRQGNTDALPDFDCEATQAALNSLDDRRKSHTAQGGKPNPHASLIGRHTCEVKDDDPAAITMNAYLAEKNTLTVSPRGKEYFARAARLADTFLSRQYIERYRLLPGTTNFDGYRGSEPEKLICLKQRGEFGVALTAVTNPANGWTSVLEYQLSSENGRLALMPTQRPIPAKLLQRLYGNEPSTMVAPATIADSYPEDKR